MSISVHGVYHQSPPPFWWGYDPQYPFPYPQGCERVGPEKALARVVFYLVILWNVEEVTVLHDHQVIQSSMENVHLDDV